MHIGTPRPVEAGRAESVTQFGISLVPATDELDRVRELARAANAAGLNLVAIHDHPYQRRFVDTWSLIPTLLAETKRSSFLTGTGKIADPARRFSRAAQLCEPRLRKPGLRTRRLRRSAGLPARGRGRLVVGSPPA